MHVQFVSATISQLTVIMKGEVLQISLLLLLLKIGLMSASAAFEVLKVASECVKITLKCLINLQCSNSASMLESDGGVHPSIRTQGGIIMFILPAESTLLGLGSVERTYSTGGKELQKESKMISQERR